MKEKKETKPERTEPERIQHAAELVDALFNQINKTKLEPLTEEDVMNILTNLADVVGDKKLTMTLFEDEINERAEKHQNRVEHYAKITVLERAKERLDRAWVKLDAELEFAFNPDLPISRKAKEFHDLVEEMHRAMLNLVSTLTLPDYFENEIIAWEEAFGPAESISKEFLQKKFENQHLGTHLVEPLRAYVREYLLYRKTTMRILGTIEGVAGALGKHPNR